jgi:hypothetical protein
MRKLIIERCGNKPGGPKLMISSKEIQLPKVGVGIV